MKVEGGLSEFGNHNGGERRRVVAISSGGGHWTELVRLAPAMRGHDVTWVTTLDGYRHSAPPGEFLVIRNATLWDKVGLAIMFVQIMRLIADIRPCCVISTGAAPGYFAMRGGKLFGARCLWVDSIANSEKLSLSGEKVGPYVDRWLTQWMHLSKVDGPFFHGSVL